MAIDVAELSTTVPDIGHGALNDMYGGGGPLRFSGDPGEFEFSMRSVSLGELGTDRVRHSMSVGLSMAPLDFFMAGWMVRGGLDRFELASDSCRLGRGEVLCYGREVPIKANWSDVEIVTLRAPFELIDRVAAERLGGGRAVRFENARSLSAEAARSWRGLTQYVWRESQRPNSTLQSPLIQRQLAELVAATALAVFPNSTMHMDVDGSHEQVHPATIRRAMAFIEENAHLPITITAIAEAAGVTPRAVQYAFARHSDTTPLAHLRRVRLERAHRQLQAADPTSGTTVAAIAVRWGFAKPTRFAAYYREQYGVPPSRTLWT